MIYEPAEDSWLLAKAVKSYSKGKRVLDMGSGSGIQATTAKNSGALEVLAADINPESVRKVNSLGVKAVKSNLFSNLSGKYDLIIFNPPYLPEEKREDKGTRIVTTGGKKGDETILRFLKYAKRFLAPKGKILLLVSSLTPKERIFSLLRKQRIQKRIIQRSRHFMEILEVWKLQAKFKTLDSNKKI